MGLMISSIAKIGNNIMPKKLFASNSDYYLYILEYANFDFQDTHNYSSYLHDGEMSRVLNTYEYVCNFKNSHIEKLQSKTFHSDGIMSWHKIFDIDNESEKITPAFLFTTINPDCLNAINWNNISDEVFIFLKLRPTNRNAKYVPQLVDEILSNIGMAVSKCKRSNITSKYGNVYFFDYGTNEHNLNNKNSVKKINKTQTVFISYSWDNENHKQWIKSLANKLTEKNIKIILDQNDLKVGDDKMTFMTNSIQNSDFILIILTPNYKSRIDNKQGGVNDEFTLIRAEISKDKNATKFIPIIRNGISNEVIPSDFNKDIIYLDMQEDNDFESKFKELYSKIIFKP